MADKGSWGAIEEKDEYDVCIAIHVVPVKPIKNDFATLEEADKFVAELAAAGNGTIMSEDGEELLSYFGHTISKDCECQPRFDGGVNNVYVHKHNA